MVTAEPDVASEAERLEYVFGQVVDPARWAGADDDERLELLEKRFGPLGEAQLAMRAVVAAELVEGRPSSMWSTVQRLDAHGLGAHAVLNQLAVVFSQALTETTDQVKAEIGGRPVADEAEGADRREQIRASFEERLTARLDRLPLPTPEAMDAALVAVVEGAAVVDSDVLVAEGVARFDEWADDPLLASLARTSVDQLLDDDAGPLVMLPGDRVAHADRLREGVVLAHVLTEAERALGTLTLSFDLAAFGRVARPSLDGRRIDVVSAEPGHLAWSGPEGWLERFEEGDTLAVQVSPSDAVEIDPLPEAPAVDDDMVAAVNRVYHEAADEPGLPVSGEELIFGLLAENRDGFGHPQAPLRAVCAAAGLEQRGSEVAHDPVLWANAAYLGRLGRVKAAARDDDELARQVMDVLDLADALADGSQGGGVEPAQVREVLDSLGDLEVLLGVGDELFGADRWSSQAELAERLVDRLLEAARRPEERANARYLAALAAEADGDLAAAEQHLSLALEADGDHHTLAVDRLAWYASDRGDAARAHRLWKRCPSRPLTAADLATIEPFAAAPKAERGRNERCWCGSGRKYKHCHLGVAEVPPLADRVGWLCRKAVDYVDRAGAAARQTVVEIVACRVSDPEDEEQIHRVLADPLVYDLVLTEGGWFDRFLAHRSSLLPDDEALLAASWAIVERTVYEITDVTAGVGLTVRDLRTGDRLDVRERSFPRHARTGALICARAVPDGHTRQFIGGIFPVTPGTETELLDLLDQRDPEQIAAWVGALDQPPQLRTRENEPLVDCEIVVTTDDSAALVAHLDASYDNTMDTTSADDAAVAQGTIRQTWTEYHDLDAKEALIRATFRLDGDRLSITTNSDARADRILTRLRDAIDNVTVLADTRTPMDASNLRASRRGGLPDLHGISEAPAVPEQAIAEIQEHMERRWCDEEVPALGGLTPRQAVADPTRREELERLLAFFEATQPPAGAFSMRTDRLRAMLGL